MRILTFTSLFPNKLNPDLGIFIFQRTAYLANRPGTSVEVVAPVPFAPTFLKRTARGPLALIPTTEEIGELKLHHPRYLLAPKVSMPLHGLLMYAGCLRYVRRLHQANSFDCIDAHYVYPDGLAAVLIGRSLGIPVVLSARGSDIHTFPGFVTIRPQIRWTLRHAAGLIAVSDSLRKIMLELEPALPDVSVVGNGIDRERFFPEDQHVARNKLGLDREDKVIVSVAALKHVKGPDLLVRAAALLKKSFPHCKVLFVGSGPDLRSLLQSAKQLDCADVCQFLGSVPNDQLRTYFNAADVSCLASRNEGWPNVVLESLACGTPTVATAVGAVPQILADPALGIVVGPTSEEICAGLSRALQQEWNSEAISTYAQRHSWENVAAGVEAALAHATGQPRS